MIHAVIVWAEVIGSGKVSLGKVSIESTPWITQKEKAKRFHAWPYGFGVRECYAASSGVTSSSNPRSFMD